MNNIHQVQVVYADDSPVATWGLREIAAVAYRRRYWLVLPLIAGLLMAGVVAFTSGAVYRSSASFLIASPQVPPSLISSSLSAYSDERIAKIRQQILRRSNLVALIERNDLYPKERATRPVDEVLGIMRDAIKVQLVGANAVTQSANGATTTIAFNLSYTYDSPAIAHRVTEQLTDMFLHEDKRLRTEQASGSAAFIGRRAEELRRRLIELETQRRAIRSRYSGALPDQVMASTQSSASLRAEISRMDAETQGLIQQNSLLVARGQELANMPVAGSPQSEVRRAKAELERLSVIYSDTHPDVVAARALLARTEVAARNDPQRSAAASAIAAEVATGRTRIDMLARRRAELIAALSRADRLISLSPQAAYELNNVDREYDNLKSQYQAIREKQLEAQVAANLQAEDRGERLSLTDPPSYPYAPLSPNRPMLMLMGMVGGLVFAMALALAYEIAVRPVQGPGAVTRLTGEPPLASIRTLPAGPSRDFLTRVDRALLWLRQGAGR